MNLNVSKLLSFVKDTVEGQDNKRAISRENKKKVGEKKTNTVEKKIAEEVQAPVEDKAVEPIPRDREVWQFSHEGRGQELLDYVSSVLDNMDLSKEHIPRTGNIYVEGNARFRGSDVIVASDMSTGEPSNDIHYIVYKRSSRESQEEPKEVVLQCQECGDIFEQKVEKCGCGCEDLKQIYPVEEDRGELDPEFKEDIVQKWYAFCAEYNLNPKASVENFPKGLQDIIRRKWPEYSKTNVSFEKAIELVRQERDQEYEKNPWEPMEGEDTGEGWEPTENENVKRKGKNSKNEAFDSTIGGKTESGVRSIVAKGIADQRDAENIARAKRGKVVSDEDDPKKFMVVVEESSEENNGKEDNKKVEAYGIMGMKNSSWRKIFRNRKEMMKWAEKHDADIMGTKDVEESNSNKKKVVSEKIRQVVTHEIVLTSPDGKKYTLPSETYNVVDVVKSGPNVFYVTDQTVEGSKTPLIISKDLVKDVVGDEPEKMDTPLVGESRIVEEIDPISFVKKLAPSAKVVVSPTGRKIQITSDLGTIKVWQGVTDNIWRSKLGDGDVDVYDSFLSALDDAVKAVDSGYSKKIFRSQSDVAKEGEMEVGESKLNEERENFKAEVPVDVFFSSETGDEEEEYRLLWNKVPFTYSVDIDYRSWGIKGIDFNLEGPITISYTGPRGDQEVEISLDQLREARVEWESANFFGPSEITMNIDAENKVSDLTIVFCYYKPGGA